MDTTFDVIVIGGGGAGLTASLYTSRARLHTLLLEKNVTGGQIAITDLVENYPGFPEGISGAAIAARMEEQTCKYGTTLQYEDVQRVTIANELFSVFTSEHTYTTRALVIATGANARMLNVPGERELIGKGVSYCATCDAPFFKGKKVAVVGGGDSALQEALYLTKFASQVYLIHRRDAFRAGALLQQRIRENPNIHCLLDTVVSSVEGTIRVGGLRVKNVKTHAEEIVSLDGVFVFIGHVPSSDCFKNLVAVNSEGYIITNVDFQTSIPGIFACGEVRQGAAWQLVAACGEGCGAGLAVEKYLEQCR